jgi:hypothetical protein
LVQESLLPWLMASSSRKHININSHFVSLSLPLLFVIYSHIFILIAVSALIPTLIYGNLAVVSVVAGFIGFASVPILSAGLEFACELAFPIGSLSFFH